MSEDGSARLLRGRTCRPTRSCTTGTWGKHAHHTDQAMRVTDSLLPVHAAPCNFILMHCEEPPSQYSPFRQLSISTRAISGWTRSETHLSREMIKA